MFELARKNRTRSLWLVCIMFGLLLAVGFTASEMYQPGSGPAGVAIAGAVALVLFVISYFSGSSILLSAAGAHEVSKEDAPQLYNVVDEMVIASRLGAMPKLYVIESNAANAFATGRNPQVAAVVVTEGLLNVLNRDELQAVIGHEIAHVKHRDILFMTLLAVMAGAIALISEVVLRGFRFGGMRRSRSSRSGGGGAALGILLVGLALMIVGAITARLVFFAASRTREYLADAGSAIFTRNPEALAQALEKISSNIAGHALPVPKVAQAMLIVGPSLFATHPPIDKRIDILRRLAGAGPLSYGSYAKSFEQVVGKRARFMPRSALAEAPVGTAVSAPAPLIPGAASFRREALDALKKQAGYEMHTCRCGAVIKIPPQHPNRALVRCLRCGAQVDS
ncbi:MAG: M48 family metallopeptidase [Deltaproteobacteria bacterium]|nr:M48 family metallopeptidase [Deltaproteobacteria bacterium]